MTNPINQQNKKVESLLTEYRTDMLEKTYHNSEGRTFDVSERITFNFTKKNQDIFKTNVEVATKFIASLNKDEVRNFQESQLSDAAGIHYPMNFPLTAAAFKRAEQESRALAPKRCCIL